MSVAVSSFPMKHVFIAFLLLLLLGSSDHIATSIRSAATEDHAFIAQQHEQWMATHGRVYKDEAEKAMRLEIFKSNLQYIESFNRAGNQTFKLGITSFVDLTNEEFNSMIGSSSIPPEDPKGTVATPYPNVNLTGIPESVDWGLSDAVTPAKNQGGCGCCWAFAGVAVVESAVKIKTGKLISLSEQQIVDCDVTMNSKGCTGGTDMDVYNYIIKNGGLTTGENYPYVGTDNNPCANDKAASVASTIRNWLLVVKKDEESLMLAVADQPTYANIVVGSPATQHYAGGVFSGDCGSTSHAGAVIGYGTENGVKFWKVKNSWGAGWGENGFWRISREATPDGGGVCRILTRNTYPIA